jgi:glutamate 5-kinase
MKNQETSLRKSHIGRVVVKVGTSLLTRDGGHLDRARMSRLVRELSAIQKKGVQVLLVSSGAIAAGMGELGWKKRPSELAKKQAAAAVGQPRLMETYRRFFHRSGVSVAQVLLTREDFENKSRRKNAQSTLLTLLAAKVIPIINENDTVAVEEIRVGDNDTLAARVAVKVKADLLVLLTDVEGLMTRHPHQGKGELIRYVPKIGAAIESIAHGTPGSDGGTGGMMTKISAARLATRNGVSMVIASGKKQGILSRLAAGQLVGTFFAAHRLRH